MGSWFHTQSFILSSGDISATDCQQSQICAAFKGALMAAFLFKNAFE
jgi:hypothetical protein